MYTMNELVVQSSFMNEWAYSVLNGPSVSEMSLHYKAFNQ